MCSSDLATTGENLRTIGVISEGSDNIDIIDLAVRNDDVVFALDDNGIIYTINLSNGDPTFFKDTGSSGTGEIGRASCRERV